METTPGKRILIWREFKGMTPAQMIKATGIKRSTLDSVEDPNGSKPSHDTLMKVVKAFPDLNAYWLLTGEGEMLADGRTLTPAPTSTKEPETEPSPPQPAGPVAAQRPNDTVAQAENVLLKEQVVDLKEDKSRLVEENQALRAEVKRLLEKFSPSLDAAEQPALPRTEMRKWPTACQPSPEAVATLVVSHSNPFAALANGLSVLDPRMTCDRQAA